MLKKLGVGLLVLGLLAGVAGFFVYRYVGSANATALEQWVARQIVGILETYITPKITFGQIDYQAPKTVVIDDLDIVGADGTEMVSLQQITLELAERPRRGQPIKIARIDVQQPDLNLLMRDGELVGWSGFVKQSAVKDQESVPEETKLSEILELQHIAVDDAAITFEDSRLGPDKMELTDISFSLELPDSNDGDRSHTLDFVLARPPLIEVKLEGRIDLDSGLLVLKPLTANVQLKEDALASLPPNVQELLREYKLDGSLQAAVEGEIPLKSPLESQVKADVELADLQLELMGYAGALQSLTVKGDYPAGPLAVSLAEFSLAEGATKFLALASGEVALKATEDAAEFVIEKVMLDGPTARFIKAGEGQFVGWSKLLDLAERETADGSAAAVEEAAENESAVAVSFGELAVKNGVVAFAGAPDAKPIQIDYNATVTPQENEAYEFVADANATGLEVHGDGTLELAAQKLRLNNGHVAIDVQQVFPLVDAVVDLAAAVGVDVSQASSFRDYKPKGTIAIDYSGDVPLDAPLNATGDFKLDVQQVDLAIQPFIGTTDKLLVNATLPQGPAKVEIANAALASSGTKIATVNQLTADITSFDLQRRSATINQIKATEPLLALIAKAPDTYIGWSELGGGAPPQPQSNPQPQQSQSQQPSQPQPASASQAAPDIVVNAATISQGALVLQTAPDAQRVKVTMDGTVATAEPRGAYRFDANVASLGIKLDTKGFVDPNNKRLRLDNGKIEANLERARPVVAAALQLAKSDGGGRIDFDRLTGRLNGTLQGDFAGTRINSANTNLALRDALIPIDAYAIPIDALDLQLQSGSDKLRANVRGSLLGGSVNMDVDGKKSGQQEFTGSWTIDKIELAQALKAAEKGALPMAGKISSAGEVRGQFAALPQSLKGSGKIDVREGRLVKLPVIADLLSLIEKVAILPKGLASDTADVDFQITGNGITITAGEIITAVAAMRVRGDIGYDQSLDLDVNAGVMEKVQGQLGEVGDLLGKLTDKALTYTVTGTFSKPKVGVKTLGIGGGRKK